ncbi:hypothetical protein GALMADRAFT_1004631 [Galerina marginata CBS 339.88]|uniref:Uncharacterized protein n=1 Tax=Galerina marginata (strain CBS 339.88) TaxID=685588 RepID=A0A067TQ57_GALM3|nr:hypothetical protein GALMADRAFT_1004631 [Galerina marginata CBS 339.88]
MQSWWGGSSARDNSSSLGLGLRRSAMAFFKAWILSAFLCSCALWALTALWCRGVGVGRSYGGSWGNRSDGGNRCNWCSGNGCLGISTDLELILVTEEAAGIQAQLWDFTSIVGDFVDFTGLDLVVHIAGSERGANGEREDGGGTVSESGGENDEVSGELHDGRFKRGVEEVLKTRGIRGSAHARR